MSCAQASHISNHLHPHSEMIMAHRLHFLQSNQRCEEYGCDSRTQQMNLPTAHLQTYATRHGSMSTELHLELRWCDHPCSLPDLTCWILTVGALQVLGVVVEHRPAALVLAMNSPEIHVIHVTCAYLPLGSLLYPSSRQSRENWQLSWMVEPELPLLLVLMNVA